MEALEERQELLAQRVVVEAGVRLVDEPGLVTASFKRDAHETMGFPFPASFCTAISLVIFVFSFSASSGGATKSEWVPAREARGCFLRRRRKSRRIDFWRNRKRAARPQVEAEARSAARRGGVIPSSMNEQLAKAIEEEIRLRELERRHG